MAKVYIDGRIRRIEAHVGTKGTWFVAYGQDTDEFIVFVDGVGGLDLLVEMFKKAAEEAKEEYHRAFSEPKEGS